MRRARILLADDHRLLLEAFEKLLQPHCEVVGTVSDGHGCSVAYSRLCPLRVICRRRGQPTFMSA